MKKIVCLFTVLSVLLLVCSCDSNSIGSRGPVGGWIFYDCDADNDETNDGAGPDNLKSSECGWRYLEVAPTDMVCGSSSRCVFGYYRATASGTNVYVNGPTYVAGTSSATDGKSTGTAIGTGKANTAKLVAAMGPTAYYESSGSVLATNYAAKLCDDYTCNGYDDWFLPSKDEIGFIQANLSARRCKLADYFYWSSSESYFGGGSSAWIQGLGKEYHINSTCYRDNYCRVRAVRSFLSFEED